MNKCLIVILVLLGLTSCTKKDEHYYELHPHQLQQAVKSCLAQKIQGLTCDKLKEIANHMSSLAYQLQNSPQDFGAKILVLQETIAKQQRQLKQGTKEAGLKEDIAHNKRNLARHLAVVKWLESPAS
jgi:hypothetical protein